MSNIIDSIQLSGVTYTLQGSGGGTVSSAITSGDTNAVAGGAVYDKFDEVEQVTARALNDLDEKINPTVELTQAQYDALVSAGTVSADTYYIITDATPVDVSQYWTSAQTQSAINQATSGKVNTSSVVSSVTSASTDSQIPTAKAVWEAASGGGTTYTAGRGISIANDTISFNLPISANTNNSIVMGGKLTNSFTNNGKDCLMVGSELTTNNGSDCCLVVGYRCSVNGDGSAVIGWASQSNGDSSFALGTNVSAKKSDSFATGYRTITNNNYEHTSGKYNVSNTGSTDADKTLFSVGNGTADNARHNAFEIRQNGDIYLSSGGTDIKLQDHLGGGGTTYTAGRGIDITSDTISVSLPISAGTGDNSIAEGRDTIASGGCSHAEGMETQANGNFSHAEGRGTTANTDYSHAEGRDTIASGYSSHAEGSGTKSYGNYSHAEGQNTKALGESSHAEGNYTKTTNKYEHASGSYNNSVSASTTFGDSGNTLFSVGNGTANNARHNAFEIRQNGDIYLSLNGQDVKLQDQLGGGSITIDTALDSGSTNPVENRVIYNKIDEIEQVTARALNELNDTFGGLKLVKLTQAEYNALTTKDSSTLYIIVN